MHTKPEAMKKGSKCQSADSWVDFSSTQTQIKSKVDTLPVPTSWTASLVSSLLEDKQDARNDVGRLRAV